MDAVVRRAQRVLVRRVRSVRWDPDSGSPSAAPRTEWLVLLDMREDVPPQFEQFKQAARRPTDQFGLRGTALATSRSLEGAEREGMRLISFLDSCGLRFAPDSNPGREDLRDGQLAAPPTSPEGIGQIEPGPARAAAAKQRVRWMVAR